MKIVKNLSHKIIDKVRIEHNSEFYIRALFFDGEVEWTPLSYDGEGGEEELEKLYQEMIKISIN